MIDRRFTSRLEGKPLIQWLDLAALPTFVGVILLFAVPTLVGCLGAAALIGLGAVIAWRTLRVIARVQLGQLTVRNHLRSATFPLASIRSIETGQSVYLRTLVSFGRLVVTDGEGRRWPLVATTGESPAMIRILVHDLLEAAPGAEVDVDLARFPHDLSRSAGTERIGGPAASDPTPARADPEEERRRRTAAGQVELERLRRELDEIRARKPKRT